MSRAPDDAVASPLGALGVSREEERVYRFLLACGTATAQDVAGGLGLPPRRAQRLLDAIEGKGFATCAPERPQRYIPARPEFAVEALIHEHEAGLERARAAIADLQQQARDAPGTIDREQMVELVTSRESECQIFEQMQRVAEHEILTMTRPPLRISRLDIPYDEDQRHQVAARARGVRYRSVVDGDYLALPGAVRHVRMDIEAGEDIRVFPCLPFKAVLADRRIAFIPLNRQQPDGPTLLVRSSALLDALYALFESIWERATPISFATDDEIVHGTEAPEHDAGELIRLFAEGLNDKAIAHELGISASTLHRRIAELMKKLGTRTRFQLGWRAALAAYPERTADTVATRAPRRSRRSDS